MTSKNSKNAFISLFLFIAGLFIIPIISSCGKATTTGGPTGLNVQYHILNLSPDLFPVNLYINYIKANTSPYVFTIDQGYFYVPSIINPYQIRSASTAGTQLFSRNDSLKIGLKYTLFITGTIGDNSLKQIFTVDTATLAAVGRGKLRFVNASPTGTGGLDVTANGTLAFSKIPYLSYSKFIELPAGNYDFQINATGSSNILKDMPGTTIQDGRAYTIYAYGYTTRIDTAAFNAAMIINQ
ncbi:MAG: hypothetical protein JWQ63_2311 [Mucilaginibacter sp.]|jgi:hypothetical protein|nr:hypothetical protein [Mucilaginibacter sp.]